ncbi:MAG: acyl-CoA thioesterase [Lachnospiraceae bacterium]
MEEERKVKRVEESWTEQVHLVMQGDVNGAGRLFGGRLLEWIDEMAGIVAKRHSGSNVITASIDNLQFKAGAYANDTVVIVGRVTYVGRSSMEIRLDSYVEDMNNFRRPINRAYFVMVALDENERPKQVPMIELETEAQKAEWEGAIKRQQYRKERRRIGF